MRRPAVKAFYTSIAPWYEDIFPPDPALAAWLDRLLPRHGRVLDIGCATGGLARNLAARSHHVTGIDLDPALVERARATAGQRKPRGEPPVFLTGDMTTLAEAVPGRDFDLVTCVGNTLVHLPDPTAIGGFLRQAHDRLRPGGALVMQIINYDRVLRIRPPGLPPLDNRKIHFDRVYKYDEEPGRIAFHTTLRVKADGTTLRNRVLLFPVTRGDLLDLIRRAGFVRPACYADQGKTRWTPSSYPLYLRAFRRR
ncbi:MAG: class I SAM-dependent methyltransferase [Candidatus Riflebacteria bacterium]|nr:class I SAM-dependent methyltransferase [Candidatus Riflebacteria bacterium]